MHLRFVPLVLWLQTWVEVVEATPTGSILRLCIQGIAIVVCVKTVCNYLMAQNWEAFVFTEVLNIGIVVAHFRTLVDELLL